MSKLGLLIGPGSHPWGTRGISVCICMQAAEPEGTGFESQVKEKADRAGHFHKFFPLWRMHLTAPLHLKGSNTQAAYHISFPRDRSHMALSSLWYWGGRTHLKFTLSNLGDWEPEPRRSQILLCEAPTAFSHSAIYQQTEHLIHPKLEGSLTHLYCYSWMSAAVMEVARES